MLSPSTLDNCLRRLLCVVLLAGWPAVLSAAEPGGHRLLLEDAALRVEINRPLRLLDHRLVQNVWREIERSPDYERQREAPEWDRILQLGTYLEAALEIGWRKAAERLTAGGIVLEAAAGPPPRIALVITADRPETMSQFVAFAQAWMRGQLADRGLERLWNTAGYRGQTCFHFGKAHASSVGKRLFVAGSEDVLKRMLDRFIDAPAQAPRPRPAAAAPPLVRWRFDMDEFRKQPNVPDGLKIPSDDIGRVVILGGWVDLLRRSNLTQGEFDLDDRALTLSIRLDAGSADVTPGLGGFFADKPDEPLAPLLAPPGTLFTASWFRDYSALWGSRRDSLDEAALKRLEDGDEKIQKQFQQFGVRVPPSEVFRLLGTLFRVVAARQTTLPYRVEPDDRLPAAALVVNLPDADAFRRNVEPFFRTVSLIAAFGEAHMLTKSTEYRDARLHGVRFRDDQQGAAESNQLRYSFSPTYSITRDQFILGSGEEIVRLVIDELDRQQDDGANSPPPGTTNLGRLSLVELADSIDDVKELLLRGTVFQTGMTIDESEQALQAVKRILAAIGEVAYRATYNPNGFEYRIEIGRARDADDSR